MIPISKPYLIGETAFHHMGNIQFLKKLIDKADDLELDAIKFHLLLDVDDYMVASHEAIDTIRNWCFSITQWEEVVKYASNKKPDLIFLCNDVASIEWVNSLPVEVNAIEIHATGINDTFLLDKASEFDDTVILGTGGSTIDEIQFAVTYLRNCNKQDLFLMHGFQNYPTDPSEIQLSRMNVLKDLFQLPVGYADHSNPKDENNETISVFGASMGFNVLEKHFTHKFGEDRIDSQAAVSLDQMRKIKSLLKVAYNAYGGEPLKMSEAEMKYGDTGPMKKAIVARKDISIGHILGKDDVAFKRTNQSSPIKQQEFFKLIGAKVKENIEKDMLITYENVQYIFPKKDIEQFKLDEDK